MYNVCGIVGALLSALADTHRRCAFRYAQYAQPLLACAFFWKGSVSLREFSHGT